MSESQPLPLISQADCQPVPVFNCHVLLRKDAAGRLTGRVSNLPSITAEGISERDVLKAITRQFKAVVQQSVNDGQPVPFQSPADVPQADEVERFIPVHL
ncbi:MAG: hypothetical protein R3C49_20555 [Planctomycetaceae bacterium]